MRLAFVFLVLVTTAHAQQVDLVRLAYDAAQLKSNQVAMAASADGKFIAFAYEDTSVKIFDIAAGKFVKRFSLPVQNLIDMHLLRLNRMAIIDNASVRIIDWKTEKELARFTLQQPASKTTYADKLGLLAVGQFEGFVTMFDVNALTQLNTLQYKKHHVSALAIHPSGQKIVVAAQGNGAFPNSLKMFDIKSGAELASSKKGVYSMAAFTRDGNNLLVGGKMGDVTYRVVTALMDAEQLALLREISSKPMRGRILNVPFGSHVTSDRVMIISDTQSFDVFDLLSGEELFTTMREGGSITAKSAIGVGSYNIFPLNGAGTKVIVNTTKNNINQIYDAEKNAMIGYFFSDSNDDFAIVARDGRVEGTPAALSKLFWTSRKSTQRTSLESTFEKGFTPQLLSVMIGANDVEQIAFEVDDVINKIPVLSLKSVSAQRGADGSSFQSNQKLVNVTVEATQGAGEITLVKLYQNAKLVKTFQNGGKSSYSFDVSLTTSFGEDNFFYAIASSRSGIDSEKIKFNIAYKGATDAKPRLFLLTIGINTYKNPKYNLNYAQADADGVNSLISKKSGSLFQEILSYTIRNDSAIKTNILGALEEIKSKALEQDMLVLYYAGHGVMSEGVEKAKEFFIVPYDVTHLYGKDELLFERAISATELKSITERINAQKQVFILDACQSSGALEAIENRARGVAEEKAIAQLARSTGTFWIASTGTDQFASEFDKLGHGIFTYTLLEGLNGAADADHDQKLTVRELSVYIENKVPELSERLKGTAQFPSAYSFGNDFPLVVFH
jgi:WD40 repeat protein